ncbi:hypothetical protein Q9L58_010663, partial [Maublancomyces gigas]
MPPKGKKNNNKNASSSTNVTGGEPSSTASSSTTSPPNPSVAPPLAPIFTSSSPNRGRSPSKRPRANTSDSPPPTNTMETLVSTMVSLTGVQNEQATTIRNFAKIIAEVHQFKTQCSPHIIPLMEDMKALRANISSLTARIAALEAAPPQPPPPQTTNAGPSDQILALAARINTTKLQRQLVVTCNPSPPTSITNDAILASVNNALKTTGVRFILARRSLKGNLVLQTAPANTASEATNHGDAIASCLTNLGCTPTLMRSNAIWTSFLVHNIPTSSTPDDVATAIQLNYPTFPPLCRHPRWLTTADKRKEKTHSTMVITLAAQLTPANLGLTSLTIANQ